MYADHNEERRYQTTVISLLRNWLNTTDPVQMMFNL